MRPRSILASFAFTALATLPLCLAQEKKDEPKKDTPAVGEDPNDLASLEALVVKVETEGNVEGVRLRDDVSIQFLKELPRPEGLTFPVSSSNKLECDFTKKYYEQYSNVFDAAAKRARECARENDVFKDAIKGDDGVLFMKTFLKKFAQPRSPKTKKDACTNEVRSLLYRMFDRYEKVRERSKTFQDKATVEKEVAARVENGKQFLKKYDFGPAIAKQHMDGASKLYFDLTKDAYELVKNNMGFLNAKPLLDSKGQEMKWRNKKLQGALAAKLSIGDGKGNIEKLLGENEYFVVQYALNEIGSPYEQLDEKSLLRLTGAKLLLGRYYVIEAHDRVVVYLPDPPQ